jgi:hypothetical protein
MDLAERNARSTVALAQLARLGVGQNNTAKVTYSTRHRVQPVLLS